MLGFRVSGLGFRASCFGFRVSSRVVRTADRGGVDSKHDASASSRADFEWAKRYRAWNVSFGVLEQRNAVGHNLNPVEDSMKFLEEEGLEARRKIFSRLGNSGPQDNTAP
jgi:hypothetical protein